ncbi:MAG: asparaginase domain-containing protein [Planctomycetota bacterium]
MRHIALISTGGTIEKTYDERTGSLENRHSIVQRMLARLRLEDTAINSIQMFQKDSTELTDLDRRRIIEIARVMSGEGDMDGDGDTDGVVILHGTDTLCVTGEMLFKEIPNPKVPIILTGAMRPFEMKRSDALQNLNESIFATNALEPGIYCVAHGRALRFPGVIKDYDRGTFVMVANASPGS